MILDSQEQKDILLRIVSTTRIQGTYQQVKEATNLVSDLIQEIEKAKIEEVKGCN